MEGNHPTEKFRREPISGFVFDPEKNIFVHPGNCTIDYQDGGEAYILESMKKVHDLSSHSLEFRQYIKDWPSRYHFSHRRLNFLEGIKEVLPKDADVLEIGSGCGTITRWLGENFRSVDALEGSVQRAAITRYRTKDLENVKVYCGDLLATDFDKKYDVITLIGSLEYIPLYDTEHEDPKEACSTLLTRLRSALKDDGILLVAIENKFGAKYFSGCKEDHTGREFEGIIGYPDKTPVTFSRNEMESILAQTGFRYNQFYHVFPDYKLTETIIPENPEVLPLHPYNWIRTPFEDYEGNRLNLFPDLLFLKSITDSGLLWQCSNSFVILARPTKTSNPAVPWLIKSYKNNENLNPTFYHELTLVRELNTSHQKKGYLVRRSPLHNAYRTDSYRNFEFQLINNDYIAGELLIYDFYTALFKKSPENSLKQVLAELHNDLLRNYSIGGKDPEGYPLVNGETIDFTFWNIIIESPGNLNFIDRKWHYKDPLPADLILFRNLFNIFERVGPYLSNKNKRSFILEMIRSIYPQYSEERLSAALDFEKLFQTYASGKSQNFTLDSPSHYSFADRITQNQEMAAQINSLNLSSAELKTSLLERTNRMDVLEQAVASGMEQMEEMTNTIHSLQQVLCITSKYQQLEEVSVKAECLERQLSKKNSQLEEINNSTKTLAETFSLKEIQLQALTARLNDQEQKLSAIETSIIWQLTMKFHYNVVEKILPLNTRRRRYYDLGLKGGRIIANNGIKRFIWDIKHYMNRGNRVGNKLPDENNQNNYMNLKYKPKISIILPTWNTPKKWLYQSINSVLSQDYPNWELCIADGGSDRPHVKAILSEYLKKDRRIKIKFLSENKGISGNSNEAFAIATGEFITLLDHDDELSSDALFEAVKLLNYTPNVEVIFSDEDKISVDGKYIDPFYKPAFSLELLRSMNYLIHGIFIKKGLIETTGFFDPHFDGAQDFDLFFRIVEKNPKIAHIPKILYHWRMSEQSGAQDALAKPWIYERGRESVENHLKRLKIDAEVTVGRGWGLYTINYNLKNSPYVDIIIPTRKIEMLKNCLKFLEKSTYKNYRIYAIINGSTDYEVVEINNFDTSRIDPFVDPKTGLIGPQLPYNWSRMNNLALQKTGSPYVITLNDDIELITEDWIERFIQYAQFEQVGSVGAMLLYKNNLIQHAGDYITPEGLGDHIFNGMRSDSFEVYGFAQIARDCSAVTSACMMVRRNIFEKIGYFDENLRNFDDFEFSSRLKKVGYSIIYSPYVKAYHLESPTRPQISNPELVKYIKQKIGRTTDPFFRYEWLNCYYNQK